MSGDFRVTFPEAVFSGTPSPCDFIFIAALYTACFRKSIQFLQKITKFISIR